MVMAEEIKFTDEEIKAYLDLQAKYQNNIVQMGQLNIRGYQIDDAIAKLKEDEQKLKDEYLALQKEEETLLTETTKKYGEGSLDIATGVFTPAS
jgi:peptidoglycan hydrolase CwlO-like protein